MKELTVALILRTASATLEEMTSALGTPSAGVNRGDLPHGGRLKHFQKPYEQTAWILRSENDEVAPLNEHLNALTKRMPPSRLSEVRRKLPHDLQVEVDVAVFHDAQAGHIDFDQQSLRVVTDYEAILNVTTYYCDDEEQKRNAEATVEP